MSCDEPQNSMSIKDLETCMKAYDREMQNMLEHPETKEVSEVWLDDYMPEEPLKTVQMSCRRKYEITKRGWRRL